MALDPKELQKPLSKLRKLLKKMPKQPPPEQVHDLRTNSRRAEATLKALQLDRKRKGKRVLKTLTPLQARWPRS
jgi:CHAD domain-containing protein